MEIPMSMPGAFLDLDHPVRPTLTKASARPSLYIPPASPSAASSLSNSIYPVPRPISTTNNGSRKRARYDTSDSALNTPRQAPQDDWTFGVASISSSTALSAAQSPAPFVNTQYRLAGGLDTPTAAIASAFEEKEDLDDLDYRPNRFTSQTRREPDGYFPHTPGPNLIGRERNGRKRSASSPTRHGWGNAVYTVVGAAGKVFSFCWNNAFRGFHAGGGKGYAMPDAGTPIMVEQSTWAEVGEREDVFNVNYKGPHYRDLTPVPGEFPEEGFIKDYMSRPQAYQAQEVWTPVQSGGGGGSTLKGNWVIVKESDVDSREVSPSRSARKIPRASTLGQARPLSRASMAGRPRLTPSRPSASSFAGSVGLNRPASYASPRGSSDRHQFHVRPQTSEGGPRRSRSSMASPRRAEGPRASLAPNISPEAQKFEKQIRRREKAEEESIKRLNQQLKDMIREGKEALGTRIDVEEEVDMEDEGYGEGTELVRESKW